MARYRGPVCRLCRRESIKLYLKGERCFSDKCAINKRNFIPGQHGKARQRKMSNYGLQLREKQKVKRVYGLLEQQFRNLFEKASKMRGVTGELLMALLERRLDNVALRIGFATSRAQGRQLVRHGHLVVNGRRVNIPSFTVKPGDEISVQEKSKKNVMILGSLDATAHTPVPSWLEVDRESFKARVIGMPKREELTAVPINEQLIVELYSK